MNEDDNEGRQGVDAEPKVLTRSESYHEPLKRSHVGPDGQVKIYFRAIDLLLTLE